MNLTDDMENKVNEEIIRHAVNRSGIREREKERQLYRQEILEALEDVTDLPRWELESIFRDITESYVRGEGDFFSIKHQAVLAAYMGAFAFGIIAIAVWLLSFRI